jgi:hypothetical protein
MYIRFGRRLAMQYSERGPRMHSCEQKFYSNFVGLCLRRFVAAVCASLRASPARVSFVHTTIKFVVPILSSSHLIVVPQPPTVVYLIPVEQQQQYSISHHILSYSKAVYTDHDDSTIPHRELACLGVRFVCHWTAGNGNRSRGC